LEALCDLLRPWDVAAGAPIVAETGGGVTYLDGSALYLDAQSLRAIAGRVARCARRSLRPEADRREAEGRAAP
jgi:fructose-1,6-bisphosphatase/inositol monophosphatase family enzyme